MTIEMSVEERWNRLDDALRLKELEQAEQARLDALQNVLLHYAGMAIEAGADVPCPHCGGPLIGSPERECRDCGARWSVEDVA